MGHSADYLMRVAREELQTGDLTAETMSKLIDLTEQAGRWAKTNLDAGVAERQTRVSEAQAAALLAVVTRAVQGLDERAGQRVLRSVAAGLREIEGGSG